MVEGEGTTAESGSNPRERGGIEYEEQESFWC